MLYALAFLWVFSIGGVTGMFLSVMSTDVHLHDTYFVVAHFHYVMMGGAITALMGGIHYWWPKMTGRMYPEKLGRIGAVIVLFGLNLTFLPQFVMGSRGMPRRYYNYLEEFQPMHQLSSLGAFTMGLGFLLVAYYLLRSLKTGPKAPDNPWGGNTLEWQTTSPPAYYNFHTPPVITEGPYEYADWTYDAKVGGYVRISKQAKS
jgi:cytochrome c oxidase subunit 1